MGRYPGTALLSVAPFRLYTTWRPRRDRVPSRAGRGRVGGEMVSLILRICMRPPERLNSVVTRTGMMKAVLVGSIDIGMALLASKDR